LTRSFSAAWPAKTPVEIITKMNAHTIAALADLSVDAATITWIRTE
jgi:hypothetical protein